MPRSASQIAEYAERLDRFAELVSLDLPISVIASRMGIADISVEHCGPAARSAA